MDLSAVKIKRYRSARTMKLKIVEDGTLVVTAHTLTPEFQIKKFLKANKEWIEEHQGKIIRNRSALTQERDKLFFRGKEYKFLLSVNGKKKVEIIGEKIIVTSPEENHQVVREILEKWYKKQAKKLFTERVPLLADLIDRNVENVTIRSQRSRWGSCSSRNTISLNWKLIQTPDWVSDYVIYHELAHLTHMNHSKKFWELVENYYPNYKKAEKWLKDNHKLLNI